MRCEKQEKRRAMRVCTSIVKEKKKGRENLDELTIIVYLLSNSKDRCHFTRDHYTNITCTTRVTKGRRGVMLSIVE